MIKSIDLNCDLGEGLNNEIHIMPYISSCNISCGLHAGDSESIREVIRMAHSRNIAIGAHPSFDDRENFGRKPVHLSNDDLYELVKSQVLWLRNACEAQGAKLHHVKPHGALYNMAATSILMSQQIIQAILDVDHELYLVGLAGSQTQLAAESSIQFIAEGFADRRYDTNTTLVARSDDGVITNPDEIIGQLESILIKNSVITRNGVEPLQIQSICLHGDTPGAKEIIPVIHQAIMELGVQISPINDAMD